MTSFDKFLADALAAGAAVTQEDNVITVEQSNGLPSATIFLTARGGFSTAWVGGYSHRRLYDLRQVTGI